MYRRLGWVGLGPPPNHLPGAAVEFSAYARQSPICTSCLRRRPFAFLFAAGPRILHSREPEAKINRVERFNFITATFLITCVLCEASPLVGSRCLSYISPKLKFGRLTHTHTLDCTFADSQSIWQGPSTESLMQIRRTAHTGYTCVYSISVIEQFNREGTEFFTMFLTD